MKKHKREAILNRFPFCVQVYEVPKKHLKNTDKIHFYGKI